MKALIISMGIVILVSLHAFAESKGALKTGEGGGQSAPGAQKPIPAALGAPSDLKLVIVPSGFKLTWKPSSQDPGRVTGYEIVRSANVASGPFVVVTVVGKGVFQYIDKTASPENIYYYKVRARAGSEYSLYSNTVTGERPPD